MDPLSIASAVVGLITAATRIGPMLQDFITHARDAPKSASQIMEEMNSITTALERLQVFLMGASQTNIARRSMISLRNIIATITACVTTYSDLEIVVRKCISDGKVQRLKWLLNEGEIGELLQRVQAHKLSLTFMLTILQCESMQEAEKSMNRLVELAEEAVASNADLRTRLDVLALGHNYPLEPMSQISTANTTSGSSQNVQTFEEDLNNSRVYRKIRPQASEYSTNSSPRESTSMSGFSDLTLENISVISVLYLPVWSRDISNASDYRFGQDGFASSMAKLSSTYPDITFPESNQNDVQAGNSYVHPSEQQGEKNGQNEDHDKLYNASFLAVSLADFKLAQETRKWNIPHLEYFPGEIIDVIGTKGELWLARNPAFVLGWVWGKHFAVVLTEEEREGASRLRKDLLTSGKKLPKHPLMRQTASALLPALAKIEDDVAEES